jgi:hypothetical protein
MVCTKTSGGTYLLNEITGDELIILQELFSAEYHRTPLKMKEFRSKMRNWHLSVDDEIMKYLNDKIKNKNNDREKIHQGGEL